MTVFWIALAVGLLLAVVYVTLAVRTFATVRRSVLAGEALERPGDGLLDVDGSGFTWKAAGAVIASTTVIVLISVDGAFWYLPPVLALGSSVAVIAAFVLDRR
jgi:hypothetical protein